MNETHNTAVILSPALAGRRISFLGFFASLRMTVLVLFSFLVASPLHAAYEAYHPKYEKDNSFEILGRGVLNGAALPLESVSTLRREAKAHSRLWPVTYVPRLFHNTFTRVSSFVIDLSILPLIAPFADDTSPRTEGMGLPKYPWNVE